MEMEHINENTIRVLIGNEDLIDRGITFLDLLGNHKEIENFFYSILEEVDVEEEFRGSEAVTFQVLPKGDGLELFISKNLPMEDLEQLEDSASSPEEISEFLRRQVETVDFNEVDGNEEDDLLTDMWESAHRRIVVALDDFEQVIQLAKEVNLYNGQTSLYLFHDEYYLETEFSIDDYNQREIENQIARLLEFSRTSQVTSETLAEYATLLMDGNALELINHYFK